MKTNEIIGMKNLKTAPTKKSHGIRTGPSSLFSTFPKGAKNQTFTIAMPPLRGNSALRGRSRDIVSQVEDKLKLDNPLPRDILEATRSSLRVLKIRNPIGCFGKYDNETKRACALLEYDARDYNVNNNDGDKRVEVPMERLAKAAFMKLRDFRDFHEKIGNFRDNLRITAKTKSKAKGKGQKDEGGSRKGAGSSNKSGIVFRMSSISSMAIQLGAFVSNSSDAAMRAQKLFQDIVGVLESSTKKGGIYGLRDVEKNQSSYEAACFYLIATSGQGKQDKNASIRRRRKVSNAFDDGDDTQQLDLNTFMEITNVPSQFRTILDYVSELKTEIESKQSTDRYTSVKSSRSRQSLGSSMPSRTTKSKTSKKRSKEEAFDVNQFMGANRTRNIDESPDDKKPENAGDLDSNNVFRDDLDIQDSNYDPRFPKRKRNTIFQEWKSKVLRAACKDARQKMSQDNSMNGEDCEKKQTLLGSKDILDFVVMGILARNGL